MKSKNELTPKEELYALRVNDRYLRSLKIIQKQIENLIEDLEEDNKIIDRQETKPEEQKYTPTDSSPDNNNLIKNALNKDYGTDSGGCMSDGK